MPNNVYIGSRYVPIFDGAWNNTKSYEPLTIVEYGNNTYTSKKPVPVGTLPTDTSYWALTGNYNGQISNLQQQITDMKDGNVPGSLQDQINDNTLDITALTNKTRDVIPYDYIVWIGDSYTQANSLGADQDKRYSTLVSNRLGLIEKNYAVGGCAFLVGPTPYPTQATNAVNDFEANNLDKTKVKYFIVGGTRNDGVVSGSNAVTYKNAVKAVINTALTNFPNAEVIILPMMWDCSLMPWNYLTTIKRTKRACEEAPNRVRVVDNCFTWLTGQFENILYQDGANVHPNVEGHRHLASHVLSAILGNNYNIQSSAALPGDGWKTGISNGFITIDKTESFIHLHIQFEVTSTSSLVSGMIYQHTINLGVPVEEVFMGDERIFSNFNTYSHNTETCPFYIDCSFNKTGDNAGTMTYEMKFYSGGVHDGQKYHADIYIKNGVKENAVTL